MSLQLTHVLKQSLRIYRFIFLVPYPGLNKHLGSRQRLNVDTVLTYFEIYCVFWECVIRENPGIMIYYASLVTSQRQGCLGDTSLGKHYQEELNSFYLILNFHQLC